MVELSLAATKEKPSHQHWEKSIRQQEETQMKERENLRGETRPSEKLQVRFQYSLFCFQCPLLKCLHYYIHVVFSLHVIPVAKCDVDFELCALEAWLLLLLLWVYEGRLAWEKSSSTYPDAHLLVQVLEGWRLLFLFGHFGFMWESQSHVGISANTLWATHSWR